MPRHDTVALLALRQAHDARFFAIQDAHACTEGVTNMRMSIQEIDIPAQHIRPSQIVIGRDQPHIFAAGETDTLVVISEMSEVWFVADVNHPPIAERIRYCRGVVRRTVVHDQYFEVLIRLGQDRLDAVGQQMSQLVTWDDEAHRRILCESSRRSIHICFSCVTKQMESELASPTTPHRVYTSMAEDPRHRAGAARTSPTPHWIARHQ